LTWPISARGQTIGCGKSLIPFSLFPELGDQIRAGRPLLDILANKYAYLPGKGSCQLFVRPATNQEALLLDITRRSPVLCAVSRLVSRSGHVCESVQVVWRPDCVTLNLEAGRT
jgi:DNA-binding GntR family transcriptional regulator